MTVQAIKRRKNRLKTRKSTTLPREWTPEFLSDVDGRLALVNEIRKRVNRLKRETGCDSYQKELLISRAVFLACYLETLEVRALREGEHIDFGSYSQSLNCLSGLLTKLGLEKSVRKAESLKDYINKGDDDDDDN